MHSSIVNMIKYFGISNQNVDNRWCGVEDLEWIGMQWRILECEVRWRVDSIRVESSEHEWSGEDT